MKGYINKAASLEIKAVNEETRTVKGYASVFNNVDSDDDRLMKGAFNRTIKSWGPEGKNRIKLVSQHNIKQPVAKIDDLYEDEKGLYMEATFGTHQDGEDHYKMVKEGILTEFSIGFVPTKEEKNDEGGRNFSEVKLYEVSLVTVASNDQALVTDVKSDEALELTKNIEDKELAFKLEKEILKLMSTKTQETTTQPAAAPDSEVEVKEASITNQLLNLYN